MTRRAKVEIEGVKRLPSGKFEIRAEYRDPNTGKTKYLENVVKARDEIHAAEILADRLSARRESRATVAPREVRFSDTIDAWLAAKRPEVRRSTHEKYAYAVDRWKRALPDYLMDRVTPEKVKGVIQWWREAEIATETINSRLATLRTFAKETGRAHIVEGVRQLDKTLREASAARRPHAEESAADLGAGRGFSEAEFAELLAIAPSAPLLVPDKRGRFRKKVPHWWHRAWSLVATLAWTAMRFGEATALEWHDLNFTLGSLRIDRAQCRGIVDRPKTDAGERIVNLTPELLAILVAHREDLRRAGLPVEGNALVFPSRRKGVAFVSNTYARKTMLTLLRAAEIDRGNRPAIHSLRHTMSNLIRRVSDETVRRKLVGHTKEIDTYTHVALAEGRATMRKVAARVRSDGAAAADATEE